MDTQNKKQKIINPSSITVVGVTGRKRSGKDTLGERLVDNYGFVRVAFADTLKEACKVIFGFSDEQVYGDDLKEITDSYWEYTPREVLQKVGTELFRDAINQPNVLPNIGNSIWIRCLERKILKMAEENGATKFVVTDMRFPNEVSFIENSNFNHLTIKVVRDAVMDNCQNLHSSEALIDSFECNHTIKNNETIDAFYSKIDHLMEFVKL